VFALDHLGDLPQTQDLPVSLQRRILVLDTIRDVVDVFESNVVRQHKRSSVLCVTLESHPIIPE
jgi:hypothetical protein